MNSYKLSFSISMFAVICLIIVYYFFGLNYSDNHLIGANDNEITSFKEPDSSLKFDAVTDRRELHQQVESSQTDSSYTYSPTSRKAKLARELEISKDIAAHSLAITSKVIYDRLKGRGANISKDIESRMISDSMTPDDWNEVRALIAKVLTDEESFKVNLSNYSSFKDYKKAFDERSKTTGFYYGNVLLEQRDIYKDATVDDLKQILNSGAQFPIDVIESMVHSKNLSLALELQKAGYIFDVNYINEFTNQNALEEYVASYAQYSNDDHAIDMINKLLELGVAVKVNDGTRDPLDFVLENVDLDNVSSRMMVAKKLLDSGIRLEQSHLDSLAEFKNKYPDIYGQYAEYFQ